MFWKNHLKRSFAVAALLFCVTTFAIAADSKKPPVKMGLWQEQVSTTIGGVAGVSSAPQRDTEQVCITRKSWSTNGLQASANRCTLENLRWNAHSLSYDAQCGAQNSVGLIFHMYILIDSDKHMHGTAGTEIATPGSANQGKWESTLTADYIGRNCGDLKPGEQKPVKQ